MSAIASIELSDVITEIRFPKEIKVLKEVTDDVRYPSLLKIR